MIVSKILTALLLKAFQGISQIPTIAYLLEKAPFGRAKFEKVSSKSYDVQAAMVLKSGLMQLCGCQTCPPGRVHKYHLDARPYDLLLLVFLGGPTKWKIAFQINRKFFFTQVAQAIFPINSLDGRRLKIAFSYGDLLAHSIQFVDAFAVHAVEYELR